MEKTLLTGNCKCGAIIEYNEKYDVHFCRTCDKWIENKCTDPECAFCVHRPDKPSDILRGSV